MRIAVVILAGGDGRRIGGDKPLRRLGGQTLLDRAIALARGWSTDIAISLRHAGQFVLPSDVAEILDEGPVENGGAGPLAGVQAALAFARGREQDAVLVIPCDTPFLPTDLPQRLSAALADGAMAAVASSGGRLHPACALWRTDALARLPAWRAGGNASLRGFASHVGMQAVEWPATPDPFFNINSETELALAEQRLPPARMVDGFGRRIDYVRLSVTDRCDLRCRYCMAETMQFLPRSELLSLEELAMLSDVLIARGVRRIRLTGGEPLVRRGIETLVETIGRRIGHGLDELTLTTNATQLAPMAQRLYDAGIRRINVSLDSLDPQRFRAITRRGELARVLEGIHAARRAGLAVKINMVALNGLNDDEIESMVQWCGSQGHDLTLIETMPLGEVGEDRTDRYLPLDMVKRRLEQRYTLIPSLHRTGGPARYHDIVETGGRIGFITPLTNNFCAGCNRIRITATGTIFGCLGHDQRIELRDAMRAGGAPAVHQALDAVMAAKPQRHDFDIGQKRPAVARHMSMTGG